MFPLLVLIPLLLVQVSAAPPVTEAHREQLASAEDHSPRLDEGALYVLLERAMDWPVGDLPDARLPNYDALAAQPAKRRGELFLIEGVLRRSQPFRLARPGSWGEAVTEWVVQHGEAPGDVAVIYFVDPENQLPQPRNGQRVRVTAAFYKVWADRDQNAEPTNYLTFVARSARVTSSAPAQFTLMPILLLLIVVGMLAIFWVIWRYASRTRVRTGGMRSVRRMSQAREPVVEAEAEEPIELPQDPAAALGELSRRHADDGARD